jgi:hypothetical protein
VDFDIYNYAEFYPALAKYTDKEGKTFLTAGMGDMLAWASKDGKYGHSKVSFGKDSLVTIVITANHPDESESMMIVPPVGGANIPEVTEEQRKANGERTAHEDQVRKAYMATFAKDDGTPKGQFLVKAAGNHGVIEGFLAAHPDQRALDLLGSLSDKDMIDVTREILEDSYQSDGSILCPRVANEFLTPYKSFFKNALSAEEQASLSNPANLIKCDRSVQQDGDPVSPAQVISGENALLLQQNIPQKQVVQLDVEDIDTAAHIPDHAAETELCDE